MSDVLGYITNDRLRMGQMVGLFPQALILERRLCEQGLGLGYHQNGQMLVKKKPQIVSDVVDLGAELSDLITNAFVAQLRSKDAYARGSENTGPFKFRTWMMVQNGAMPGFDGIRPRLIASLSDFIAKNIRGQSEGEVCFHTLIQRIIDAGVLVEPRIAAERLHTILRQHLDAMAKWATPEGSGVGSFVLTNGQVLCCAAVGQALHLYRVGNIEGYRAQGLLVSSLLPAAGAAAETLAAGSIGVVDARLQWTAS